MKYLPLLLIISTKLALASEADFMKQYPQIPPKSTDEGRRAWDQLIKYFETSKNPKLVELALNAKVIGQKSAIENAIATYDLFIIDPNAFITGAKKIDQTYNCLFPTLIPRTQYIPFENIQKRIKKVKNPSKDLIYFTQRANIYYKFIQDKKLIDDDYQCKKIPKKSK
jgi:hypothetical protein